MNCISCIYAIHGKAKSCRRQIMYNVQFIILYLTPKSNSP